MKPLGHFNLRSTIWCAATLLALSLSSQAAVKPDAADDSERWINFGGGGGSVRGGLGSDDGGLSGGLSFSYFKAGHLFSLRWTETTEFKLDLWGYSGPPDGVWDIGALYGRALKGACGFVSLAAGIGLVGCSEDGVTSHHAGLPLESQLFWTPASVIGFGLYGFANLNSQKSFAGALLCVQLRIGR